MRLKSDLSDGSRNLTLLSLLLSTLKSLLIRRSIVFTLASVPFGASLEDDVAGIVGELWILVNAVNVDAVVVLDYRMLDQLFLLVFRPVHGAFGSTADQLLFVLPGSIDGTFVSMLEDSSSLDNRIDAILDDDDRIGAVQPQFFAVLIAMLVDVVSGDIEHSAESQQLVFVVAQFQQIILYKVEHVLVVNVEVEIEEE